MSTAKHTFFCPEIDQGYLTEDESNHAVRVLRLKENDYINLIDGKGKFAHARIIHADKRKLGFEIESKKFQEKNKSSIHIAIAPTKSLDRFNFFIEKAIEIGVNRITPIRTSNSERKQLNSEKIEKHAISAMKQSGNYYLPKLDEMIDFNTFIQAQDNKNQRFIAHCESDDKKVELKSQVDPLKDTLILIGPEGDFTKEEINLAKENHFLPVSLGENRLRTETAGIVACLTLTILS